LGGGNKASSARNAIGHGVSGYDQLKEGRTISEPIRHTPARGRLVVKVKPGAQAQQLASVGRAEPVGRDDLVVVHLPEADADPKQAWQRAMRSDAVEWAAPVLQDETDEEHVPTGEITVRFDRRPSQRDLDRFASANGLKFRDRNEFVGEQAAFQVAEPRQTYLPDLISELSRKRGVSRAWANTLSRYRKA